MIDKRIRGIREDIQVGDFMRGMGMTYCILEIYPGGTFRGEVVEVRGVKPTMLIIHANASLQQFTHLKRTDYEQSI
ncbi:hypothetical protein [Janthinobacterium sp.]|uniref:hypothetical protein n=1 Tax=Janthinobacterium sp. TaxID=1871054 RepID=UPI00260ED59C|nr:hypothetical protein [Janthinobacterium sp.]